MAQPLGPLQKLTGPTGRNLLSLYGALAVGYLLSFLTLPYLARVLGPSGFGALAVAQSLALYLSVVVEYGFGLSATREAARFRSDPRRLAGLLADVLSARLVLSGVVVALAYLLGRLVPALGGEEALLLSGALFAVAQGVSPAWYFGGLERLWVVALLEAVPRALGAVGIFAFVHGPAEAYLALLLPGLAVLLANGLGWAWALREVGFIPPGLPSAIRGLRLGFSLFLFRAVVSLYTSASAFILGLFVPAEKVGYYAGAERPIRALSASFEPVNRTFLPRLSHLVHHDPPRALRLAKRVAMSMGLMGLLLGGGVAFGAPLLVRLLLGSGFEPAIPLVRILALFLPFVAVNIALGLQWMVALGLDRAYNHIAVGMGLLNLGLAAVLAPLFAQSGMAWAVVLAEVFGTMALATYLHRLGKAPWQGGLGWP